MKMETQPLYIDSPKGGGWIQTFSGTRFMFENPTTDSILIEDIAQSLSNQCRYNGHCSNFYSVAEHSILLADWYLDEHGEIYTSYRTAYELLLHDATEAYLSDIPRPIKHVLPDYKNLETTIDKVIAYKFGMRYPHSPIIKELDTRILVDEKRQLMKSISIPWGMDHIEGLGIELRFMSPDVARTQFLKRYHKLREEMDACL